MGKIRSLFISAIFCLSFLNLSFSQTVILKSGQKVEGEIIEHTDKYVKVEFEGVELIFYSDEIYSIEQNSSGGANTVTPQMESLYRAYAASLSAPPPLNKEVAEEPAKPILLGKTQSDQLIPISQAGPTDLETLNLSALPLKEMVKSVIAKRQVEGIKQKEEGQ